MAKRSFLLIAVVAFLGFSSVASAEYWTYAHQYLPNTLATNADTGDPQGLFTVYDNAMDSVNLVVTSPADDTFSVAYAITNKDGVVLRPDAFSFSTGVTAWLASPTKYLYYSVAERYGPTGLNQWQYGADDAIRQLGYSGLEWIMKQVEPLVCDKGSYLPDSTLGMPDLLVDNNGIVQGRLQRGNELALADFTIRQDAADPDARIYFSGGRYGAYRFGGGYYGWRPGVVWAGGLGPTLYAGSDFGGRANAGDILTAATLFSSPSFGIFEYAWKIAGTMLGDKFWLPANGSLVWNNANGYVAATTAANAPEVAGHSQMRNFMRYIFDITAMKVEDVDGDGKFDSADGDKVLFTLQSDRFYVAGITQWGNITGWFSDVMVLQGQFFPGGLGDAIYLYQDESVTTYMDRGEAQLFFGAPISTGNATIWGEKFGEYNITGFDILDYGIVPEPSTMILIIGAGLALGAGILRKRMR
jgi:hypothetical protein